MTTKVNETLHTSFSDFRKFKQLRVRDEEDFARAEEVVKLRRQLIPHFRNPFATKSAQNKAAVHFLEMSSRLIQEVYLSHEVAYAYCIEKVKASHRAACSEQELKDIEDSVNDSIRNEEARSA